MSNNDTAENKLRDALDRLMEEDIRRYEASPAPEGFSWRAADGRGSAAKSTKGQRRGRIIRFVTYAAAACLLVAAGYGAGYFGGSGKLVPVKIDNREKTSEAPAETETAVTTGGLTTETAGTDELSETTQAAVSASGNEELTSPPEAGGAVSPQKSEEPEDGDHGELIPQQEPDDEELAPQQEPGGEELVPQQEPEDVELVPQQEPGGEELAPQQEPGGEELVPQQEPEDVELVPQQEPEGDEIVPRQEPEDVELVPQQEPEDGERVPRLDDEEAGGFWSLFPWQMGEDLDPATESGDQGEGDEPVSSVESEGFIPLEENADESRVRTEDESTYSSTGSMEQKLVTAYHITGSSADPEADFQSVKEQLESLGGYVEQSSAEGGGLTCTLRVPCAGTEEFLLFLNELLTVTEQVVTENDITEDYYHMAAGLESYRDGVSALEAFALESGELSDTSAITAAIETLNSAVLSCEEAMSAISVQTSYTAISLQLADETAGKD